MNKSKEERVRRITISPELPILQALKKMDELQVKLLLIKEEQLFTGLVSIGDIQRAIIRNVSLDNHVSSILRTGILYADAQTSFDDIKKQMLASRLECMPVVNAENELVEVHFWDELFGQERLTNEGSLSVPVVIMAGGKGTRLRPITNILPKPLIPIGDKTILEHILDSFVAAGCNHFLMSLNYKAEMIRHYFDTLENNKYNISYFTETNFLGTAGSLHLLKDKLKETFFVTNCDIIVDTDYTEVYNYHKAQQNDITIVGVMKHYPIAYGVLETGENGKLIKIQEKPELTFKINSGLYILEPSVFEKIPERHYHITELIEDVKASGGKVGVFPVNDGAWMDIGEWSEYNKTAQKMGYGKFSVEEL